MSAAPHPQTWLMHRAGAVIENHRIVPTTDFGALIEQYRDRRGLSRAAVADLAGVDRSYITRLVAGTREPPSRLIVEALSRAMRLTSWEESRLYVAAGLAPQVVADLGWTSTLQDVAAVLADDELADADRAEFAALVSAIARRWKS